MSRIIEMNKLICVSTTFASREDALEMAQKVVEERLVACAQLHEALSLYRWQGKVMLEGEWVLVMKTTLKRYERLEPYLKEHHPYDVPEIIVTEIIHAESTYGQWIEDETAE